MEMTNLYFLFLQDATDLEDKYNTVASQLDSKYNDTRNAKNRADKLRDRAAKLYQDTYEKIEKLRGKSNTLLICFTVE